MSFFKGGYQILDLTGVTESPITVAGAYAKCLSGKPILVKGLSGIEAPQYFNKISNDDGSISLQTVVYSEETVILINVTVTNEDAASVSLVEIAQPESGNAES